VLLKLLLLEAQGTHLKTLKRDLSNKTFFREKEFFQKQLFSAAC
jgi:hypothetical protein